MILSAVTLHGSLRRLGVDALLFNSSEILPSVNLRHVTGFTGSDGAVLITAKERHLFTDGRYGIQARNEARGFRLHVVRRRLDALARTVKAAGVSRLGIEASRVSHEFTTNLARRLPDVRLVSVPKSFLDGLRVRKTPEEKARIERAARCASDACGSLLERRLTGRVEKDVAAELETLFRRCGADGPGFETIVASGERGALPHGAASDKVINVGELVVVDYGCVIDGYHSDETVTCVTGAPTSEQRKMHQAVYTAHMRAIEALRVGMRVRDVDRIARNSIAAAGYGKYFVHGLGHGVGLEIHEPPSLSPLGKGLVEEGMVFTIEPGIYIEGFGGVRLESLVYMDRTGPELLSRMSKDLIVVE
ncbi:MAG: aminopeptidase P family protein [Desulfomonile sp.]|nr:aminopeptidase P family protein [Desulfomonile sp.]